MFRNEETIINLAYKKKKKKMLRSAFNNLFSKLNFYFLEKS